MRIAIAALLMLTPALVINAQEREKETGQAHTTLEAEFTIEHAGYARELWVGIPGASLGMGEVTDGDLRKALSKGCSDTTSVAVIQPKLEGATEDVEALAVLASRRALKAVRASVDARMRPEGAGEASDTRVVLVGVMESCGVALRLATEESSGVSGVVLIDPPVGDLPAIESSRAVGVDVLLHPRSDRELERETMALIVRLGSWGKSVRVLRGRSNFDNLKERVADAWQQLRGYRVLGDDAPASITDLGPALKGFQVIFAGELHGNPGAHLVELELLRQMAAEGGPLALATEQFERDTQTVLDAYLAGKITETEFRKNARAWPNYADYRPLVEFCKTHKIPVIAGNIPRRLASRVYKEGVEVVETFSDDEKSWCAPELKALPGAYREKFFGAMGGMGNQGDGLERMYASQCFKDDTMADSVAKWLAANPKGRVLHINGNFHSKAGLGVPEKLSAMLPDVKSAMVTCVQPDEEAEAAADEWLVLVPGMRPMRRKADESSGH